MGDAAERKEDRLTQRLQAFLDRNPEAGLRHQEDEHAVVRPWGDEAMELAVDGEDDPLVDALNTVRLPPRFTAIWHEDAKAVEVIYTAIGVDSELRGRDFQFRFKGRDYRCAFEASSPTLILIALAWHPIGPSLTEHRNLDSFHFYEHTLKHQLPDSALEEGELISFWVYGAPSYEEDAMVELVRHINFHMKYFDRKVPRIVIHSRLQRPSENVTRDRYPTGVFPHKIGAKTINPYLLSLWESASQGDTLLRFLHYYQILEYAGFYYVENDILWSIKRLISAPDAPSKPQDTARKILDTMVADNVHEAQKIKEVLKACIDPVALWSEIEMESESFGGGTVLDGGFVMPEVVTKGMMLDQFEKDWVEKFSTALRNIRNALAHSREKRQATTITPTPRNREQLVPWLAPLSYAAASVMLYANLGMDDD